METINFGKKLTDDIIGELLSSNSALLCEIDLHDKKHKMRVMKRIVFSFIGIKGRHLSRTVNKENSNMIRHCKTKEILFNHQ